MTIQRQQSIDLLMFAIATAVPAVLPGIVDRSEKQSLPEDRAFRVVTNAGDALRLVHRHGPRLLMVWVAPEQLKASTVLIDALRRRRPELPLLAVTPATDAAIERAVRASGAGYYFALDGDPDPPLLRQTLAALGLPYARASPSERTPPKIGKSRIRGRPPAVYRSP